MMMIMMTVMVLVMVMVMMMMMMMMTMMNIVSQNSVPFFEAVKYSETSIKWTPN